jgi:hypothetical protein
VEVYYRVIGRLFAHCPSVGRVLKTGDMLTKRIEIRRGKQVIPCLTIEDIRDLGEARELSVMEPSMELDEDDCCRNGCMHCH